MKYIQYIYAYAFFVVGIVISDLLIYLTIGPAFFSSELEITTNWFIASILSSVIFIPSYILGVACLMLGEHFTGIDFTRPRKTLFAWAFISSIFLQLIPVLTFTWNWAEFLSILFIGTWMPIVLTSLMYFLIKRYR